LVELEMEREQLSSSVAVLDSDLQTHREARKKAEALRVVAEKDLAADKELKVTPGPLLHNTTTVNLQHYDPYFLILNSFVYNTMTVTLHNHNRSARSWRRRWRTY
jgi:hypothetical protein